LESSIKTLFVKQSLDILGPRTSYTWSDGIEVELLKLFKGKVSLYELLVYFKSDYVIVETLTKSPWLDTLIKQPGYADTMKSTTSNVVKHQQIDYGKYDLVITHDPILGPWMEAYQKAYPKTVFAYLLAEHTSWQLHQLGFQYDLYLDHTLQSGEKVVRLPQALNMLFPRVPNKLRQIFPNKKTNMFLDYRTIGHLISGGSKNVALKPDEVKRFFDSNVFPLPCTEISDTSLKPFMFGGSDDDGVNYYSKLSKAKYFVSIANRVGQAAFDAASVGSLVVGTDKSSLHRSLCHPSVLLSGEITTETINEKIKELEANQITYVNALNHQENFLNLYCIDKPIKDITQACTIKTS
jgi:hypothetical protein